MNAGNPAYQRPNSKILIVRAIHGKRGVRRTRGGNDKKTKTAPLAFSIDLTQAILIIHLDGRTCRQQGNIRHKNKILRDRAAFAWGDKIRDSPANPIALRQLAQQFFLPGQKQGAALSNLFCGINGVEHFLLHDSSYPKMVFISSCTEGMASFLT